ncbi:hypothetical protein [Cupriavidus sp. D39]|uniref:hypothetical protein n=1 Tax=Cupriavidus sp. D39 TaxID=2997877 RepID=UPI00226FF3B0|nr:hypothetical protein [Cupriavidus sp. D39]MCY0853572.1 hypothetical protein [Cupriavidus sp. D39]
MASKRVVACLAAAALIGLVNPALPVHGAQAYADTPLQVQEMNGITYVSGGVGDDEVKAIRSIAGRFNVRLGFYNAKGGEALSDVAVSVVDSNGKRRLRVVSSGPLLYMRLPAGAYTLRAEYQDDSQARRFTAGHTPVSYVFRLRVNEMEDDWVYCESKCPRRGR